MSVKLCPLPSCHGAPWRTLPRRHIIDARRTDTRARPPPHEHVSLANCGAARRGAEGASFPMRSGAAGWSPTATVPHHTATLCVAAPADRAGTVERSDAAHMAAVRASVGEPVSSIVSSRERQGERGDGPVRKS